MTNSSATQSPRLTAAKLVDRLRRQIQLGELAPGEWLREARLCAEHGIGRSTVREALRVLAEDGLVRFERFRGACVAQATLVEMFDMFEVRAALFGVVARFVCFRGSDELIKEVQTKIVRLIADAVNLTPPADRVRLGIEVVALMSTVAGEDTRKMMFASNRKARWQYSFMGLAESPGGTGPMEAWRLLSEALGRRDANAAAEQARQVIYFMQQEVTRVMVARGLA